MTTALFVHDHRFFRDPEGRVYSEGKITNEVFQRYLEAVDNVVVYARMQEILTPDGLREITEKQVSFHPVSGKSMSWIFTRHARHNAALLECLIDRSDLAVLRLPSFLALWAAFRLRRRGIPYFAEVVGFPREAIAESGSGKARRILATLTEWLTRRAVSQAQGAIYVTREILQRRLPNTGLTAFASNVELMVNPVSSLPASKPLDACTVTFGLIGSFKNRYKGIDIAAKAISLLCDRGYDCRLRILGSGDKEMVLSDAACVGVDDRIEFSGTLSSGADVYAWLDTLDIYLQPSRTEGLPRALVEAMSRGLPALGSDVGGIPELLSKTSIHASGDAEQLSVQMERLIVNPALRMQEGKRNAATATEYTRAVLGPRRKAFWRAAGDIALSGAPRSERRLLLVGSYAPSLMNFRGPLLEALCERGFEVHVAAPGIGEDKVTSAWLETRGIRSHDIPLTRAGLSPLGDLRALLTLFQLMRHIRPHIFFGYTIKPVIWGLLAAWFASVPRRVALITGLGYAFTGTAHGKRRFVQHIVRYLYAIALRRATTIIFQNPDDRDDFTRLRLLPSSLPVAVVNGSGVDIAAFAPAPLPEKPIQFLLIARLIGDKGIREYAAAAAMIRQRWPKVKFHLVGGLDPNPDGIPEMEVRDWHNSGDIIWHGPIDDVRVSIAAAHVYVLPSYREGTPRTVLEAMAMGRPIVTTDAPGCRETVIDGVNGFLVPVRNAKELAAALTRFIQDPDLLSKMGSESLKVAREKYDVHKVNAMMLCEMGL